MIDPRLAPLLAEALSLKMDVKIETCDGEYDVFWDGIGRICDTQQEVCDWLDKEISAFCKSRGQPRPFGFDGVGVVEALLAGSTGKSTLGLGLADFRRAIEPYPALIYNTNLSDEAIEEIRRAFSSAEPGTIIAFEQEKYKEIASFVTSPYRTAADQERLLSFQEEAARVSKHTRPAGNNEEG